MSDLVISFDDLNPHQTPRPHKEVPNGYQGFDWSSVDFIPDTSKSKYDNEGGIAGGTTSGHGVAIMRLDSEHSASVSLEGSFTFKSAEFTSADGSLTGLSIDGYKNGVLEHQYTTNIEGTSPTLVSMTWSNIDKLVIGTGDDGSALIMDDLTVSHVKAASTAAVHEQAFAGLHLDSHAAFMPLHGPEHLAIA